MPKKRKQKDPIEVPNTLLIARLRIEISFKWFFSCVYGRIRRLSLKVEHLELKERQLQAIMGDLRRSERNMGFLRKKTFNHFNRFGIEGLLSISLILILILVLRGPIIFLYVNFLAIFRLPFPAITGDFPERYLDEDRKSKSKIRILRLQVLIKDHLSIENQMSIIEKRKSEMRRIENPKIQNPGTGVPSPHLTSPAMKISQVFCYLFLTTILSYYMIIVIIRIIKQQVQMDFM